MMIEPRIVSRLTHVDSFTHTYAYTYTYTHTRRYDPRYSYFRFSFVFLLYTKEIASNERIVADLRDTSIHDKKDSCLLLLRSITYITLFSLYHIVEIVSLYV